MLREITETRCYLVRAERAAGHTYVRGTELSAFSEACLDLAGLLLAQSAYSPRITWLQLVIHAPEGTYRWDWGR